MTDIFLSHFSEDSKRVDENTVKAAKEKMKRNKTLVITGPAECGKTSLAVELAKSYAKDEVLMFSSPDKIETIDFQQTCLVIIDDFVGKYGFQRKKVIEWFLRFDQLYMAVTAGKLNIIVTCETTQLYKCKDEIKSHPLLSNQLVLTKHSKYVKHESSGGPALDESEKSPGHGCHTSRRFGQDSTNGGGKQYDSQGSSTNIFHHLINQNNTGEVPDALAEEEVINDNEVQTDCSFNLNQQQQQKQQQQQQQNQQHMQMQKQHLLNQQQQQQQQKQANMNSTKQVLPQPSPRGKTPQQQQQQQKSSYPVLNNSKQPQQHAQLDEQQQHQLLQQQQLQTQISRQHQQNQSMQQQMLSQAQSQSARLQQQHAAQQQMISHAQIQHRLLQQQQQQGLKQHQLVQQQQLRQQLVKTSVEEIEEDLNRQLLQTEQEIEENNKKLASLGLPPVSVQHYQLRTVNNSDYLGSVRVNNSGNQPGSGDGRIRTMLTNSKETVSTNQSLIKQPPPAMQKINKSNVVLEGGGQFEEGQADMIKDRLGNSRTMVWTNGEFVPYVKDNRTYNQKMTDRFLSHYSEKSKQMDENTVKAAKEKLKKNKMLVITGPAESGKTSLAVALAKSYAKGKVLMFRSPDKIEAIDFQRTSLVIIDDFVGKYGFQRKKVIEWFQRLINFTWR